ncbi:MAG TPA: transposase [Edaphocola sp.]|nr:transposase [Edaphocola sp.]
MIYPANVGEYLSIDEVSLSNGELYTFVTNKIGRGKRGSLVASIKGTRSQDIIDTLERLPLESRKKVKEITLDMAKNIESAVRMTFPEASLVTDRFHVVKLVMEALQHLRIKKRWEELDKENALILKCKSEGKKYKSKEFSNGDTPKQLLARSRYIIAKKEIQWTENQRERAEILFKEHPDLHIAYKHSLAFRSIYEEKLRSTAEKRFKEWMNNTFEKELKTFYTTANTVKTNFENILNFYTNRNTNANAESFNAKIKLFRANLRGVTDTSFFLFRLEKLFA